MRAIMQTKRIPGLYSRVVDKQTRTSDHLNPNIEAKVGISEGGTLEPDVPQKEKEKGKRRCPPTF